MTFKARQCYVIMRESWNTNPEDETDQHDHTPVAVFFDLETAEGNAEGYNLTMEEQGIDGIKFYVAITASYE